MQGARTIKENAAELIVSSAVFPTTLKLPFGDELVLKKTFADEAPRGIEITAGFPVANKQAESVKVALEKEVFVVVVPLL